MCQPGKPCAAGLAAISKMSDIVSIETFGKVAQDLIEAGQESQGRAFATIYAAHLSGFAPATEYIEWTIRAFQADLEMAEKQHDNLQEKIQALVAMLASGNKNEYQA